VDSRLVLRSLFAFPKSAFLPDTPTKSPAPRRATAALARARRVWRATCLLSALLFASVAVSPLHAQTAHFAGAVTTLGGGFYSPSGVAVDSSGNIYVADSSSVKGAVYEMPAGCASSSCVTTLGGGFFEPAQLAVDGNGNVYVVDLNGSVTEMPAGCSSSSCVTALGGGFVYPFGVAVDASGNVYVTDQQNGGAVKEMPPGCTSTNFTNNACAIGTLGGGFQSAQGVTVDGSGNVYVTDQQNGGAVKEMPSGCSSSSCVTMLGGGFDNPWGVAVDTSGNVYVADLDSGLVKEMPPGCTSSNFTGGACTITTLGSAFNYPYAVAVDGSGNVYVASANNGFVDEISPHGVNFGAVAVGTTGPVQTLYFAFTAGGSGVTVSALTQGAQGLDFTDPGTGSCDTNGTGHAYSAGDTCTVDVMFAPQLPGSRNGAVELLDGSGNVLASGYVQGTGVGPQVNFLPGVQSTVVSGLSTVAGVAVDGSGNLYVVDLAADAVYKETLSAGGYSQSVVANAANNGLIYPVGVAVDGSGNVYIADFSGATVYKETPTSGGYSQSVVANNASNGLYWPNAVAVDGSGNVYISDQADQWVVKETPLAGGYTQSVVANRAINGLIEPCGVAVDGNGNVYIADDDFNFGLNIVLKETLSSGGYTQSVVVNGAPNGGLAFPIGVAVDGGGNVYIASPVFGGAQVWKETPSGGGYTQSVVPAIALFEPIAVAVDGKGNVYIGDTGGGNPRVLKEDFSDPTSMSFASTEVGSQSSDSPQTVTLENIGNAPLTFLVPGTGENPSISANFTLDASTTCPEVLTSSSAGTLAAGASCNLAVDFIPTTGGPITRSLVLTDNNLNASAATQSMGLSGTALVPVASIFPGSLTFGAQDAGTTSVSQPVTLSNTGSGPLTTSIAIGALLGNLPNPNFSETDNCNGSVPAGSFCTINVTFSPSATGLLTDVLVVTDNSNGVVGSTQMVSLSGTGNTYNGSSPLLTTLYNFCSQPNCADGTGPGSPLIQGPDGNLYGTNGSGIALGIVGLGGGTVFRMTPAGAITTLYTFCSQPNCSDGYIYPNGVGNGSLVLASDGNFYGTTYAGGANPGPSDTCEVGNCGGTVFRMTAEGSLTTLYSFCAQANCTDGRSPVGLVQGLDGNFYGATENGGANNQGTFFRISPSGNLTTLYSFCSQPNCDDGGEPWSAPIQGSDGNFYGTTYNGGTANYGTVFKITPTGTLTTLYSGTGQNDEYPTGPLVQETDGNFYGTAVRGDVFKITPQGELTILSGTENGYPYAGLIQASDGNFYGTFYVGDDGGVSESNSCDSYSGCGSLFQITPGGLLTALYGFCSQANCSDGYYPIAGLMQATNGILYGTTIAGGTGGAGSGPLGSGSGAGTFFSLNNGLPRFVQTIPTIGSVGSTVLILGNGLTGASAVTFNGTSAAFNVLSDTEIQASVPLGATTGAVQVSTPGGTLSSNVAFQVLAQATPIVPYIQVNGGAWQQTATVAVNVGDTVNLGPQPQTGGSWNWTGPNSFTSTSRVLNSIALTSASNVYTATYTNTSGANSTQAFTITINPTTIVPYLQVNGGAWQQTASVAVNVGDTVNLGPQPQTGGSWSWTGPNGFTSTSRVLNAIALTSASNVYTATYTNTSGANSTQAFTITINPTPIVPYLQVNGGAWQQSSTATVNSGATVNLGPQPQSGGTWSWTGPNGFTSTSRVLNSITLTSSSNVYTATYTNTSGVNSTQAFTITVNSTPIVPYLQVNGGAWQHSASVTVNVGDTVNLGPQPQSGGTWSWTGPNSFTSTSRVINSIAITSPSNVYTATYTNTDGVNSTQAFTITVNSTPIVPYLQVNGGAWQQLSSISVNVGDTVNLGPQPQSGGTWSWTGPNGFTSTSRVLNSIALTSGTNVYTATYTNVDGVAGTPQAFTITINPTPIVPYLQVNGGPWQQASSATVNSGATVNLGPQPKSGGTWSWTGPNGFTSTSREIDAVPLTTGSNVYTATFKNTDGVASTQAFTITVN
jgi:uncharacterized repeat protein (TIGR03803 family)